MNDEPWLTEQRAFDEALRNYQTAEAELKKEDNTTTRQQLLEALKAFIVASRQLKRSKQENIPVTV